MKDLVVWRRSHQISSPLTNPFQGKSKFVTLIKIFVYLKKISDQCLLSLIGSEQSRLLRFHLLESSDGIGMREYFGHWLIEQDSVIRTFDLNKGTRVINEWIGITLSIPAVRHPTVTILPYFPIMADNGTTAIMNSSSTQNSWFIRTSGWLWAWNYFKAWNGNCRIKVSS